MDCSVSFTSTPRPSAIPRPSRLPLPGPASILGTNPTPTRSILTPAPLVETRINQSVGRQSLLGTVRGRGSVAPLQTPSRTGTSTMKGAPSYLQARQPLGPPLRAQSKQEPRASPNCRHTIGKGVIIERRSSEQENEAVEDDSHLGLEDSTAISDESLLPHIPSAILRPRPSLSDRTIESLSHVPGPGSNRRSSFFNPQSPMTPLRPPSVLDNSSVNKLNYGTIRRNALPRPSSPLKKSAGVATTPASVRPIPSRYMSSTLPRNSSYLLATGPPITLRTTTIATNATPRTARPAPRPPPPVASRRRSSLLPVEGRKSTVPPISVRPAVKAPMCSGFANKPGPRLVAESRSAKSVSRATSTIQNKTILAENTSVKNASSVALRAQIVQAKAAARKGAPVASNKPFRPNGRATPDFDAIADPFNQGLKPDLGPLHRRIDAARQDGRLNIAAMGLTCVPEEVMHMYDPEAMEHSSVVWSETVDLCRLNAADNEIEEIGDSIFPDDGIEALSEGIEAKGNQFGGLELLDLHGNMLKQLPIGLRRLEILTTLNLSRNNFTNDIFAVISQIVSIKDLNLSSNDLTKEVPESIGLLTSLETLDLHSNKLVLLPSALSGLTALRALNLSDNRFSDLALDSLSHLPHLHTLNASMNALTGSLFPSTVISLPSLQVLEVANNSLASLAFSGPLHLPSLTHLDVSRNRLYALPSLATWTSLHTLLVEDNGLTVLPDGFMKLEKLKVADLGGNALRSIDVELGRMRGLERLGLKGNPLRERRLECMAWEDVKKLLQGRLRDVEEAEADVKTF